MQTLATTVQLFIGARVLLGFGLTFCLTGSPLLITELAYPTQARQSLPSSFQTSNGYFSAVDCPASITPAGMLGVLQTRGPYMLCIARLRVSGHGSKLNAKVATSMVLNTRLGSRP